MKARFRKEKPWVGVAHQDAGSKDNKHIDGVTHCQSSHEKAKTFYHSYWGSSITVERQARACCCGKYGWPTFSERFPQALGTFLCVPEWGTVKHELGFPLGLLLFNGITMVNENEVVCCKSRDDE